MESKYDVTVIVEYRFTVDATNIDGAFQAAREYDEYWTDSTVSSITVSQPGLAPVERGE